jgi:hypothetical protein
LTWRRTTTTTSRCPARRPNDEETTLFGQTVMTGMQLKRILDDHKSCVHQPGNERPNQTDNEGIDPAAAQIASTPRMQPTSFSHVPSPTAGTLAGQTETRRIDPWPPWLKPFLAMI